MLNEIEIKGKDLEEALQLAQKELKTTKDNISYEIIEESNKTLFSILAPKYVIIKAKVKEIEKIENNKKEEKSIRKELNDEEKEQIKNVATEFLSEIFYKLNIEASFKLNYTENILKIDVNSKDAKVLIGYRGEVLEALQLIISLVINNKLNTNVKIQLDVENYREKRKKVLEELANKVAQNVIRTGKSIALEPMVAYERKIIHLTLQENNKIQTTSVGEEPYRKVVIKLK